MPKVRIPPPYRGPTHGTAELSVEGASVLECLEAMERKFPGFLPTGARRGRQRHRFVKLFKNGKLLRGEALARAARRR